MPTHRLVLALSFALLLTGCPKSDGRGGPDASAGAVKPAALDASAVADAGTPADAGRGDAGGLSSKARAQVVHDIAEGRKLARAKDWPGAAKAFERAVATAPDDVHALADLGWSAFQAGDLARAEQVNKRALAHAKDPKTRAPILYNIGRVAEARGDKDAAKKAYTESLALRDNAEVKSRLASLGGAGNDATGLTCPQSFASNTELCACLKTHKDDVFTMDTPPICKPAPVSLSLGDTRLGVILWGAENLGEKAHLLTVKEGDKLRVVAELGRDYEPGAFGVHNEAEVKGAEKRKVNGHEIVVVRSEQHDSDSNLGGIELCTRDAKLETVCSLGATPGSSKCTPAIPVEVESGCGIGVEPDESELDDDTRKEVAEVKKNATHSRATTAWTVSNDGTVMVTLKEGAKDLVDPSVLRSHVIWK